MTLTATVHETTVPLRWSDVDVLNHVNNVHYADFADEARTRLLAQGLVRDLDVVALGIDYLAPVPYDGGSLVVRTRVEPAGLHHDLYAGGVLRARIEQRLGERPELEPLHDPPVTRDLPTRHTDAGADARVRPATWTNLVQEARVALMSEHGLRVIGPMVVARYDLELGHAGVLGEQVWLHSQVSRVGTTSAVVLSEVSTATGVGARAESRIVAFDPRTERPRPWEDAERTLRELVA